jgi:hypothetical protein
VELCWAAYARDQRIAACDGSPLRRATATDADGQFGFDDLPAGALSVWTRPARGGRWRRLAEPATATGPVDVDLGDLGP